MDSPAPLGYAVGQTDGTSRVPAQAGVQEIRFYNVPFALACSPENRRGGPRLCPKAPFAFSSRCLLQASIAQPGDYLTMGHVKLGQSWPNCGIPIFIPRHDRAYMRPHETLQDTMRLRLRRWFVAEEAGFGVFCI